MCWRPWIYCIAAASSIATSNILDVRSLEECMETDFAAAWQAMDTAERAQQSDSYDFRWVPDKARDAAYALLGKTELRAEERGSYEELHERYWLERFAALLRWHSYRQPLCLLLEGAQWLDQGTLKLVFFAIRFLAVSKGRGHPRQVVWVLNHRPKDLEGDALDLVNEQLRSVERMEQAPVSLRLPSFGVEDATELAASMLQLPATDPELRQFIAMMAEKRDMTPLFVEQALWALFSKGALYVEGTRGR